MDGPKPLRAGLPELKMSDQFDWNKRNGQARGARPPPPDRPIAGAVDLELKDVRGGTRRLDEFVAMEKFDGVRVLWNGRAITHHLEGCRSRLSHWLQRSRSPMLESRSSAAFRQSAFRQ